MFSSSSRTTTRTPDGRFEEIVVRLIPSRLSPSEETKLRRSSTSETTRSYDALVYANMEINPLHPLPPMYLEQYGQIDNLTLVAVEQVGVRWGHYKEYLEAFIEGEKDPNHMRSRLIETLSPGLEKLFQTSFPTNKPVRMWWSSETPELDDLPWELIAYSTRGFNKGKFSFVRGLPGEWAPLVPLEKTKLRLAFIHDPARTSDALRAALLGLSKSASIQVVPMTGSPRDALSRAAREKFELVHIVADGTVSLAYEGILELGSDKTERIAPSELSSMLFGSRVSILGLSPVETLQTSDATQCTPTAYRAFVCLGASRQVLPTIVTPLGPLSQLQQKKFWSRFYQGLATSLSVEDAMSKAQESGPPAAVALFLRHRLGREFVRSKVSRSRGAKAASATTAKAAPNVISADLQVSRSLLDDLRAVDSKYANLSDNITDTPSAAAESTRQDNLDAALTPWFDLAAEDKQ
ncbi:MAG: hypothetical protein WBP93_21975 [Pyrinomonadaceae bacterium]